METILDAIMEKGYYKPEIEEFCVGFEYEFLSHSTRLMLFDFNENNKPEYLSPSLETWKNQVFTGQEYSMFASFDLKTYCETDNIRVKILNREDIEAEGFIYRWSEDSKGRFVLSKDRKCERTGNPDAWRIFYNPTNQWMIIDTHNANKNRFVGTIKNKTEFKKLIKQLGI